MLIALVRRSRGSKQLKNGRVSAETVACRRSAYLYLTDDADVEDVASWVFPYANRSVHYHSYHHERNDLREKTSTRVKATDNGSPMQSFKARRAL